MSNNPSFWRDEERALADAFVRDGADIVLLDLMLPEIAGGDVFRAIRERSAVPIIMVTARDDQVDKITHENAMRWYSFDPFTHVPKAEASVGALRAKATGNDVSIMSRSTRAQNHEASLAGFRRRA